MNIEHLEVGQIHKNYKELCIVLGEEVKSGNSKDRQLVNWKRYFDWKKEGVKFTISKIYNKPLEKIDNRRNQESMFLKARSHLIKYLNDNLNNDLSNHSIHSKAECQWICPECNKLHIRTIYRVSMNNHTKCEYCCSSKGEKVVMNILNKFGLNFINEFQFEDLVGKNNIKLRYDFAVIVNNDLACIIEYDGTYHDDIKFLEYDEVKDDYCLDNNIELIRIHHSELKDIEYVLANKLSNIIPNNEIIKDILQKRYNKLTGQFDLISKKINDLNKNYIM